MIFPIVVVVAAPILMLIARKKLGIDALPAILVTAVVTWAITTFVLDTLVPDGSNLGALVTVFFGIIPWLGIATAALVATRLRGGFVSALLLGLLGWFVGLVVDFALGGLGIASRYFWDYALLLAAPSGYAALGAVVAAQAAKQS